MRARAGARRPVGLLCELVTLGLLAACAHFPENPRLQGYDPARPGYRFENLEVGVANTTSLFVCVSLSGGGTRAAALAFGVLRKLRDTPIDGGARRLLDEVDVISATSGGSFAAAHYGCVGEKRFFAEFEDSVLHRDLASELFWRGTLRPWNSIRLMSPWYERSDLAAELYAETIFGRCTFSALQARGRPFIVLNATNLSRGVRFEFTQDEFDILGSSLGPVLVARAVAASAAFPFLLTPVTFVNHPCPEGFRLPPSVSAALADGRDAQGELVRASERDRRGYARARNQRLLVTEKERHRFVHLADGGISDILALGAIMDSYRTGAIGSLIRSGSISTLVVIVVNARNRIPDDMDVTSRAPGVLDVVMRSLAVSIESGAFEMVELVKDLRDARDRMQANGARAPRIHVVEVDLEDLTDESRRDRLLAVGTTFGLPRDVVQDLVAAGEELLDQSLEFRRLTAELR